MSVNIHGKEYITVAERVEAAHNEGEIISIETEYLPNESMVVCKATVRFKNGSFFMGTSAANPSKAIEKMSPYEVAETSAVGRALGFAGYGIVEGIATADEINKVNAPENAASMYDINAALEKMTKVSKLEEVSADPERLTRVQTTIKGLEEAKAGKRLISKSQCKTIVESANGTLEKYK